MRRRKLATMMSVAAVLALVALVAAACGASASGPTTYTNKDYRFSLTYDASALKQGSFTTSQNAGSAVFGTGFFDPKGTVVDGQLRDGIGVNVYKLKQIVTDALMPQVKAALTGLLPQLTAGLGTGGTIGSLEDFQVSGVKGFAADAGFSIGSTPFKARVYFLIRGDLEYEINTQAAASRWDQMRPMLEKVVNSFKVTQ